jgi:signal transduction histidine kinase
VTRAETQRLPWILLVGTIPVFVATLVLTGLNGSFGEDATFIVLAILMILGYTTVGALIASRGVGGPIGWFMMSVGIGFLFSAFTSEYAVYAHRTNPGGLPFGTAAAWLNNVVWLPAIVPLILVLLLFPTGRVPSPRWRWLPRTVVALTALGVGGTILWAGELDIAPGIHIDNPTGVPALEALVTLMQQIAGIGLICTAIAAVVALVLRFRRTRGDERQQIRWLVYVAAVGVMFFVVAGLASLGMRPNESRPFADAMFYAFFVCMGLGVPAAAGIAILRYRLWELDVVVKKTLVAAVLVATLTGISVLALGFVGTLFVGLSGPTTLILAVGIAIGVAAWPLRRFARRAADRVVYGGRATPYEVLTDFSGRLADAYSTEDVLPRMAAVLASGTGAQRVSVWLRVGRDLRSVATWPDDAGGTPEGTSWFEVRHQGEPLGAISASMPANDPMTPSKERLIGDLATQAGLVLRNVRLIEELRASRRRIVPAQDARARKLERDIHDGAQQQLVALAVKLGLARAMLDRDPAKARDLIEQLRSDANDALDNLRDLARGVYPPLLADKGLGAALHAQAAKATLPVGVSVDGVIRYEEQIEAAVYFCALEALNNAVKHGQASRVEVELGANDSTLRFEVRDDGRGFEPESAPQGTGLQGMSDRLEAIGGTLTVISTPGGGTKVLGEVPLASLDQA